MWWKRRGAAGIRAILRSDWDPVFANGVPEAADEYDGYIGPIGRMLREGRAAFEVAAYLTHITTDRMELEGWAEQNEGVAEQLVRWYADEMACAD